MPEARFYAANAKHKGAYTLPAEFDARRAGWAFGCDVCNDVCPWNLKFATPTTVAEFRRRPDLDRRDPLAFERLDDETFHHRFGDTPLARPGLARMRRNVALAQAGRSPDAP